MTRSIPAPLFRKMLFTGLIGAGCMLFGIVYYFLRQDRILLILSLLVLLGSLGQVLSFYRIAKNKKYDLVEGTCVGVTQKIIGRFQTVRMMDDDGVETTLRLSKNCILKIGAKYRFYFMQREETDTGNQYFNTALATDSFLGCEYIKEESLH